MELRTFIAVLSIIALIHSNCWTQSESYYQEPHRPQFHFSPEQGWMNDPNGMVYFEGEYHLFYQHYPYATVWGPMHWGHAVSQDLVHWEHLPIALYPDEHGLIFSGSAVVDRKNTSGFGTMDNPPLVAVFTYHNMLGERSGKEDFQTQGIAYSLDKGRTWTKYKANPVLPNPGIRDFRDPKVIWHEGSQQWVMILAAKDRIHLYNSSNLKEWSFASEFGRNTAPQLGVWECPDLFPLKVEGSQAEKWVMIVSHGGGGLNGGSCTRYFIGDFDGKTFQSDFPVEQVNWLDYGKDNYAGVTWSDVLDDNGSRLFMGWMSNWQYANYVPTDKWRSAMTVVRSLTLRETPAGLRVYSNPVKSLESLREKEVAIPTTIISGTMPVWEIAPSMSELLLSFDLNNADSKSFGVELTNNLGESLRIGYDVASNLIIIDRSNAGKVNFSNDFGGGLQYIPLPIGSGHGTGYHLEGGKMKWRILFDRSSFELFVDDGAMAVTEIFFSTVDFSQLNLFSFGGKVRLEEGRVYELAGIWDEK